MVIWPYTNAVSSQNLSFDVDKASRVYRATHSLAFADIPVVDMKDRLSVITVAAGLRRVGVLETWGQRLPQIRERMISTGLATSVATCVWSSIERPVDTPHWEVLQALDELRVAGKPKHVMWFYPNPKEREQQRRRNFTQQQAGVLLQYPPCCIAFESAVMSRLPEAQLQSLVGEIGADNAKLMGRLRRNAKLDSPKIPLPDNGLRTEQRLPFALHVACDACLSDSESPSAVVNAQYSELVRNLDAALHALFLAIQQTYCQITQDQSANRELLLQVRTMHSKFFSHGS
jgi:hypothetical protein